MGEVVLAAFPKSRLKPIDNSAPSVVPIRYNGVMTKRMIELRLRALHEKMLEPIGEDSVVEKKKTRNVTNKLLDAAWGCGEGVIYVAQCLTPLIKEAHIGFAEASRMLGYEPPPSYPDAPYRPTSHYPLLVNDPASSGISGIDCEL